MEREMSIVYLESATVHFMSSDTKKTFPSVAEARAAAEAYVGNRAAAKPFPTEETYFYGPGNGDTTVTVMQDIDMDAFMGRVAAAQA
jgi:hypothetical protein